MTYDSSRFRPDATYSDEPAGPEDGFADSPRFRDSFAYRDSIAYPDAGGYADEGFDRPTAYAPGTYPVDDYTGREYGVDGTDDGEPAAAVPVRPVRDRIGVHLGWELVLLLAAAAVGYLLYRAEPGALRGGNLGGLYINAAALGFITVGMALSLRAAVPNLALGPLAYAAALFFADNSDRGLLVTAGVTGLLAIGVGLVLALAITALRVPAWAASLAAALGLIVWIQQHREPVGVVNGAYRPTEQPLIWFAAFVGLSVLGGALGLLPGLRRAVGRYRPAGDPAKRGPGAGSAALAVIGSSVLAAASGVLLALYNREVNPTENGVALTGLALGAALLGGTSVHGRRGGLFGTALAVILLSLLVAYGEAEELRVHVLGLAAAVIAVGLLVSAAVEALGRSRGGAVAENDLTDGPEARDDSAYTGPADRSAPESWNGGSGGAAGPWSPPPPRDVPDRWDEPWGAR